MEFGRVSDELLDSINFVLPPDRPETTTLLRNQKGDHTAIKVGCAKWGRKDWIGKIYPPKTKEADFLSHYAKHFNSIELNATFYKMPSFRQTKSWSEKVGDQFEFCPKFSGQITHMKRLKDLSTIDRFLKGMSGFGERLGSLLLMPHPQMGPKALPAIKAFLEALPNDLKVFVELRHEGWFSDVLAAQELFGFLEERKVGTVITDASGRRDCVHMRLTTPEAFIRFVGNGLHRTDYERVDAWVERIALWKSQGIRKVYFFMHQHEEIHSPELARYAIEQLNKHCAANLHVPVFESAPVNPS